jgi:hypothetical protein
MVRLERDDHFPEHAYTQVFKTKEALKCKPEKENQTWSTHRSLPKETRKR